jgi:adenine-specific DNA glycosylase
LRQQRVESLPTLQKRPKATKRYFHAFIVDRRGKFLVRQRAEKTVNALLWEFPNVETASSDADPRELACQLLEAVLHLEPVAVFHHTITRYRIQLRVYRATGSQVRVEAGEWVSKAQLVSLPFSSAHRRIAQWVTEGTVPCRS